MSQERGAQMRYRIGLKVLEAGRWLRGRMNYFDAEGYDLPFGEQPAWFQRAVREVPPGADGSIVRLGDVLNVHWNGERQTALDGDWVAYFPETGAILVIQNWLFEQLDLVPAPIEVL